MELQQIRVLQAVARLGSLSKAALALQRTQPSVTLSLQSLEKELGRPLVERSGRATKLTAEGAAFLERGARVLEEWEKLPAFFLEKSNAPPGALRVGAGDGAVNFLLAEPARRFHARFPAVDLRLVNQPLEDTLDMLKRGDLDFGFRGRMKPPPGFRYHPRMTFNRLLIAPPGHPALAGSLTLQRLASFPFVMPARTSLTRKMIESAFEKIGLTPRVAVEAGHWDALKRYVRAGLGIGVLSEFCVEKVGPEKIPSRDVSPLFGHDIYGVLFKEDRPLNERAAAFLKELT